MQFVDRFRYSGAATDSPDPERAAVSSWGKRGSQERPDRSNWRSVTIYPPGAIFADRYRIEVLIGGGGTGTVYTASDTETGDRVALKLLKPELALRPDVRNRLRRDGRLAAALSH